MDLDYPSEKKHDLSQEVKKLDRRFGSIVLSNPRIEFPKKHIPSWIIKKLTHYIENDCHSHLLFLMEKQAINIRDQISDTYVGWNLLHLCAKSNASKSTLNLLRNLYQQEPNKTVDGDTSLLIACQYHANQTLSILLEMGGIDIYVTNQKKVMAYQIAFSSNNQEALKQLMKYQMRSKQNNKINIQALCKKVERQSQSCCPQIMGCILGFLGFHKNDQTPCKETQTDRKMNKNSQAVQGLPQISWLQPQIVFSKKMPLFTNISSPFSIKQGTVIVSHLLIIFQSLAYYPELLRNIIHKKKQQYQVILSKQRSLINLNIQPIFPFFNQTHQPLFLSLNEELWPMFLQKALCQVYNGFFQPGKIPVQTLLQTITSNTAYKINLNQYASNKQLFYTLIGNFESQNCIYILKASDQCPFKSQDGRIQCYSLLKRSQGNYLINCPFKCLQGQKRQHKQKKQMKMQKIHYISQNNQSLWITQDQFFNFFSQIIYCHTQIPRQFMKSHKMNVSTKDNEYIRFYLSIKLPQTKQKREQVDSDSVNQKNLQISLIMKSLLEGSQKMLKYQQPITMQNCSGWTLKSRKNTTNISKIQKISSKIFGDTLVSLQQVYNQIFVEVKINLSKYRASLYEYFMEYKSSIRNSQMPNNPIQQLILLFKSSENFEIQLIDAFIGDLEFVQCCKNYYNTHKQQFEGPNIQKVGDYIIVLVPSTHDSYIQFQKEIQEDDVIEGCLVSDGNRLQLLPFGEISYAVFLSSESLECHNFKVYSSEEVDTAESNIKQSQ